jgi:predicted dehydrogenase
VSLHVAVIGVGHLGKHHARILSLLPGVELVAVVDTNRARAEEIAAAHRTTAAFDAREIAGRVDAVTIAVPTDVHRDIALPFLHAGVAVLVEKPMARSLAEADELIAAAAKAGATLAVGHTERFNPAVAAARPLLRDPRFIEVHRLGTFPERSLDIDVVFDLMIHDLDVVLSLVKSDVRPGADRPRRHRERTAAVRERLHREPDGQPHQPRPRPEDPILSAVRVPVDRLRRTESRDVSPREGKRADAVHPRGRRRCDRRRAAQARARRFRGRRRVAPRADGDGRGRPPRARRRAADYR